MVDPRSGARPSSGIPARPRGAFAGASWPRIRWILCRTGGPTIAHAMLSQRRDSSKRDGAFRLQRFQRGVRKWWHLRIECPDLIVLFGGPGGMCGNAPRLLWGQMVCSRRNTAGARSPRSGAPLFPRNPKAGPSFPCAWAFGDRRWRGRRQVAIGPPGLFGLISRDDLGA